jgi:hypothetical protein
VARVGADHRDLQRLSDNPGQECNYEATKFKVVTTGCRRSAVGSADFDRHGLVADVAADEFDLQQFRSQIRFEHCRVLD